MVYMDTHLLHSHVIYDVENINMHFMQNTVLSFYILNNLIITIIIILFTIFSIINFRFSVGD